MIAVTVVVVIIIIISPGAAPPSLLAFPSPRRPSVTWQPRIPLWGAVTERGRSSRKTSTNVAFVRRGKHMIEMTFLGMAPCNVT